MPIDINELRDYKGGDPEKWKGYMEKRFKDPAIVDQVLELDATWRDLRSKVDTLRTDVNRLQKTVIAPKKKAKENCDAEVAQMKEIQKTIKEHEAKMPEIEAQRDSLLGRIGNVVDPEVPISQDEDEDNLVVCLSPMPPEAEGNDKLLPSPAGTLSYTLPAAKPLLPVRSTLVAPILPDPMFRTSP